MKIRDVEEILFGFFDIQQKYSLHVPSLLENAVALTNIRPER